MKFSRVLGKRKDVYKKLLHLYYDGRVCNIDLWFAITNFLSSAKKLDKKSFLVDRNPTPPPSTGPVFVSYMSA